jgi:FixJ family two-component response regulator
VPFTSHALDAGAFDVLPKPFRREHLIASLCQALRAHTLARDIRAADERLVRVQRRLDEGKATVSTLRRKAAKLVNPVVVEAVILHSRAMAASEHAKGLLDAMHQWRHFLRDALRMVEENARHVALTRARAGGYGDFIHCAGR